MASATVEELKAANTRAQALFRSAWDRETAGDYEGAFALYAEANRYGRMRYGWSVEPDKRNYATPDEHAAQHTREVENLEWLYAPELFQHAPPGHPSRAPIFIVGLPRSGSTLIEQLLATHSQVQGMGETGAFYWIARSRYPVGMGPAPGPNHFRTMGADYLAAIEKEGWRRAARPRFTDKMLSNYMYAGTIHLALPRATILHAVRNPLDMLLSCWRGDFSDNNETQYCYDLAELGAHYVRYRKVMDHWRRVLPPGRIIDIEHERLVADLPTEARALLERCGLRWEEGVLRFHENPREVKTMSREQVKRPIFTESVGRWRAYKRHLGPLIEALGPYAVEAMDGASDGT